MVLLPNILLYQIYDNKLINACSYVNKIFLLFYKTNYYLV